MSSNSNSHQRPPRRLRPPGIPNNQEPCSSSRRVRKSPLDCSHSTSSRGTLPTGKKQSATPNRRKAEKQERSTGPCPKLSLIRQVSTTDKISLRDVASERVDVISEWMHAQPGEILEELKNELRTIHERAFVPKNKEEFLLLKKLLQDRTDLNEETLTRAHTVQLQIFVTLSTSVQAFLHPTLTISNSSLVEIFLYKRCRNLRCQSCLPADGCDCGICASRKGFCTQCMCMICSKYDYEEKTYRWIGCKSCSHWIHAECAVHGGQIQVDSITNGDSGSPEMVFKCPACQNMSELFVWVKDVFSECGPTWDHETLMRELDFVSSIFRRSGDLRGRKFCCKCEDLLDKLRSGLPEALACKLMLLFFQELEMQPSKNPGTEEGERPLGPQEACNQIAKLVQETLEKLGMVADEKMDMCNKARSALEACDRELEDKTRKAAELKLQMQHEKQQIDGLQSIAKLKQAEADIFQLMANEERREAERLKLIVLAESAKSGKEDARSYLKFRMNVAEAEKQYLFAKIKVRENSRDFQSSSSGDPQMTLLSNNIQDLLKNMHDGESSRALPSSSRGDPQMLLPPNNIQGLVENMHDGLPKSDGKTNDKGPLNSMP